MAINLLTTLQNEGDCIATFYNGDEALVTIEFDIPHIQAARMPKSFSNADMVDTERFVKVFDFTNNRFRVLRRRNVRNLLPLHKLLDNEAVLR